MDESGNEAMPQTLSILGMDVTPRRSFATITWRPTTTHDDTEFQALYEPLDGVERLERYQPGGYHPIQIGDQFHGRYRVIHKLGHGSYSTMWVAQDEQKKKLVALKICTARSNSNEVNIISALTHPRFPVTNDSGKAMISSILDTFTVHGPNGTHACHITTPARASLSGLKDGSWIRLFQLDVARALAAQLVLAADYLHTQGFKFGAPEPEPVIHLDEKPLPPGVPSHGIVPLWLGAASEKITLPEARILLTDFGESFSCSDPKELKYESRTPLVIRPPECRFEPHKPLSYVSDIWTLACTIWSIIAQRPLFEGFLATEDDMTREHVDTLGILPLEWWRGWEARREKFTEDGRPINRNPFRSWSDRFEDSVQQPRRQEGMPVLGDDERDAIFDMLRPMLAFRPEERCTTKQILESEWMVKWALPAYEKIPRSDQ
ncbi:kinase-like protein [Aspergillus aculeatinus CBS 121060]|uniref:Kinase-like protein n=1 Tax=Aspergillus aculeatinus CBS 121060 TaxID=1448322 RepID=A0ACD1HC00_9EURO|nr:kinase-like protein [Aspergillus aculeatinus CBS 121060]RAH71180.1 kinase-like protein [Aspergillus aculeatinus CBS 121060]